MKELITALQNLLTYQPLVGDSEDNLGLIELDYTARLKDLKQQYDEVIRASDVRAILEAFNPTKEITEIKLPSSAIVVDSEEALPLINPNMAMIRRMARRQLGDAPTFNTSVIVALDEKGTVIVLKNSDVASNEVGPAGRIVPNASIVTDYTIK